jgi:DNA helicase-2/ATP-dependent DNA helicase PcrA
MTLHAAKGLEFPLVILPGWEESVFPSQMALDENGTKALEEERRLAYVGLTRAREQAIIYFAANRQIYGRWQGVIPSRFVDELPPEHVEARAETGYYGQDGNAGGGRSAGVADIAQGSSYDSPGWRRFQSAKTRGKVIEGQAKAIAKPGAGGFCVQDRVFHDKFGYGHIRKMDGDKVEVAFDKAGTKKLMVGFLKDPSSL